MLARERFRLLILLLFFLSGISGLVYQIVWTRLLVLVFGNTLLANSTVVAAFMAGLAAGSYFFGRFVDERPRRLVRLYALLEAGIGGFADPPHQGQGMWAQELSVLSTARCASRPIPRLEPPPGRSPRAQHRDPGAGADP
jgi:MFS family permease